MCVPAACESDLCHSLSLNFRPLELLFSPCYSASKSGTSQHRGSAGACFVASERDLTSVELVPHDTLDTVVYRDPVGAHF